MVQQRLALWANTGVSEFEFRKHQFSTITDVLPTHPTAWTNGETTIIIISLYELYIIILKT